uniref:Uncharacterized protein n=1 Tax=Oryza punctata TaxID=4537 RepID=A0A0E0JLM8_ORYPU
MINVLINIVTLFNPPGQNKKRAIIYRYLKRYISVLRYNPVPVGGLYWSEDGATGEDGSTLPTLEVFPLRNHSNSPKALLTG